MASCLSAALLVSAGYSFSARPRFEAVAAIEIDPGVAGSPAEGWWESQSHRLMESALLSRVVSIYDLAGSPELASGPMRTPVERLWTRLAASRGRDRSNTDAATAALRSRLSIRRAADPRGFLIVVRAYDAKFTALAANGVGRTFVDDASPSSSSQREDPAAWLAARLQARDAVRAVEAGQGGAATERRRRLEADLALARDRAARSARTAEELNARLARLRQDAATERFETLELASSQAVQAVRREMAETDARRADLEQSLGPRHPDVVAIHDRLQRQREALSREVGRLVHEAEVAADGSARAAGIDRDSVAALRTELAAVAVPVPAASPALLETEPPTQDSTLEVRGRGVPLGAGMTARFLSAAEVPSQPFAPSFGRDLEFGAALGLAIGLSLAVARARLSSSPGRAGK